MKQGDAVNISVKTLYEEYGNNLTFCEIQHNNDYDYYDFCDFDMVLCADGEKCKIKQIDDDNNIVQLENKCGENVALFWLTMEELQTAVFR